MGTICPCPTPGAAMLAHRVEGLRLRVVVSCAENAVRMKRCCGTGWSWVCED